MKQKKLFTGKFIINISIFIVVLFIVPFFREYNTIMNIDWGLVERKVEAMGNIGQDVVFCPGYLKFFPTSYHFFGKFNSKTKPNYKNSNYQDYILVGFCSENTKYTYLYKPHKLSLDISKKAYTEKTPINIKDIYKLAKIELVSTSETKECKLSHDVFDCGEKDWQKLGLQYDFIDGKKFLCLSTHPQENATLNLYFDKIGEGKVFLGYFDSAANIPYLNNEINFKINGQSYVLNKKNRLKIISIPTGTLDLNVSSKNITTNWVCMGYESKI